VAKAYELSGYYPGSYSITYNAARKEITIALDNLKFAEAAKPVATKKKKAR
jgi:hypothetical protein